MVKLLYFKLRERIISEKYFLSIALLAGMAVALNFQTPSFQFKRNAVLRPPGFEAWVVQYNRVAQVADSSGLVSGIFLGSKNTIAPETYSLFRVTGILHLVAASGFNCWIVAKVFSLLALSVVHILWYRLTTKALLNLRRFCVPVASLLGAWCFYFWSDQSPPITRATLLITSKYFLDLLGVHPSPLRFLSTHYLLFLIPGPRLFVSPSFQLSFFCLFGMFLSQNIAERFVSSRPKLERFLEKPVLKFFYNNLLTSLGASLGAIPITFIFFQEANVTGVLTNFFAIPITSVWIMPWALLGILLLPIQLDVASLCISLASLGGNLLVFSLELFLKLDCILTL